MRSIPLPDPPLTDGEIRLRPWERGDVPAVTAACQDPEIPRWTVVPHNYTERHARDFIAGTAADLAAGRELALAVVDADDRVLGALGMSNFDWADMKGEIGYWMAPEARRRGIGARATQDARRVGAHDARASSASSCWRTRRTRRPSGSPSGPASRARALLRRYRRRHGVREDLVMFSLLAEDLGREPDARDGRRSASRARRRHTSSGGPAIRPAALEPLAARSERDDGARPRRRHRQAHARARRERGAA